MRNTDELGLKTGLWDPFNPESHLLPGYFVPIFWTFSVLMAVRGAPTWACLFLIGCGALVACTRMFPMLRSPDADLNLVAAEKSSVEEVRDTPPGANSGAEDRQEADSHSRWEDEGGR